jgi:hypothetical protein
LQGSENEPSKQGEQPERPKQSHALNEVGERFENLLHFIISFALSYVSIIPHFQVFVYSYFAQSFCVEFVHFAIPKIESTVRP